MMRWWKAIDPGEFQMGSKEYWESAQNGGDDVPPPEGHVGNESGHAHSRFGDEKLYRVMEAGEDDLRELPPIPDKPAVIAKRDDDGALRPWPE